MSVLENPSAALLEAYTSLRSFESDLIYLQNENIEFADTEELLQLASDLHLVKTLVSDLFNELQTVVTDHVSSLPAPVSVEGATVEIKSGSPRKSWDHSSLISDVSKRIVDKSVDLETGEVTMSPREMIEHAIEYMGVSYWKVGKLKELHIDADEYCEVGESKKSLVIRRNS